jgi:uncharacterized surface protein with fasciclin (FAS1) repeats
MPGVTGRKTGREKIMVRTITAAAFGAALSVLTVSAAEMDIVDTAAGAGSFNTLVAAVEAAGLVETLKGEGPFTVFAPTDEAFAALPEGTVASLLLPENRDQLVAVLTYHVIPGRVMSSDIAGQEMMVATVQGSEVDINATDGVMVDEATVVTADIEATNGVIHVIDRVILPQ